jgi:phenylalanine-4-hydroxylase
MEFGSWRSRLRSKLFDEARSLSIMKKELPFHLKKYIVEQAPQKYTPIDQSVWRFVLRQLKTYLSKHAHESYQEGLKKTGITIEEIPSIENISKSLESFGWSAAPVSGFIPPSAFLEMQAMRVLPIAADMRTIDHLTYTPAPDIVHEAAGHAPMVAHPEFRKYLEEYAQVARKAIINKKDLELYEAIRDLSDIKEHPNATSQEIACAQKKLDEISANMGNPSEAALLARMAWWTTEYGLIGHNNPRIYGAGLLSSAGEGKSALSSETQKIPFSIDCIKYSYDITEPQPQLFVADDFKTLSRVLQEFAKTMAFSVGGLHGLKVAQEAETANTVEFDSGLQVSGVLKNILIESDQPIYLQFVGPCQLSYKEKELHGQGRQRHIEGFGCPVGKIKTQTKNKIVWESGVTLEGELVGNVIQEKQEILRTYKNCKVTLKDKVLFDPSWGEYDLAMGEKVVSVFGGAADVEAYGEFEDFSAKRIPGKVHSDKQKDLFELYQRVRDLRQNLKKNSNIASDLQKVLDQLNKNHPHDWLLKLEIFELSFQLSEKPFWVKDIANELEQRAKKDQDIGHFIMEGIRLAPQLEI